MKTNHIPHRFAGAATAAVLALTATIAFAQESAPVADPVVVSPPGVAEPITSGPAASVPVTTTAERVAADPVVAVPAATASTTAPAKPAARSRATIASRPAPAAAAPVAAAPAIAPLPVAALLPEAAPLIVSQAEPAPPAVVDPGAPADVPGDNGLALAGLAGLLALGGASLLAMTRRRRRIAEQAEVVFEDAFAPEPVPRPEPVATIPAYVEPAEVAAPEPALAAAGTEYAIYAPAAQAEPVAGRTLEGETFTEELVRMTAEQPDEANPFVSSKRRRKRARALLQQRNREQEQAAPESRPTFDWDSLQPGQTQTTKVLEYV